MVVDQKPKSIPLAIYTAIGIIILVVLPWGKALKVFELSYRLKIAYVSALIILVGLIILMVRALMHKIKFRQLPTGISHEIQRGDKKKGKELLLTGLDDTIKKDNKKLLYLSIFIVILFWAPFILKGPDIHVKIFDNLDCHIPHIKVLAESKKTFSLDPNTRLDNFINGMPLYGIDSGFNVLTWLFMISSPFTAYAVNDLLVRMIALLGMTLLLRNHLLKDSQNDWNNLIIFGSALCFALLPFYPAGGISIAGIPLLLYGFLNILNYKGRYTDFIIILFFPFYSKLALAGIFIIILLAGIYIFDLVKKKRSNFTYLGALGLLCATYLFTHFHLVYSYIDPNFISFRGEIRTVTWGTVECFKRSLQNSIYNRVNVVGAQHEFVISATALAIIIVIIKKLKAKGLVLLVSSIIFTSLMWGFKYWQHFVPLREKFQLLNAFDLSRFYWFNPFLWYLVFAIALGIISKIKLGGVIAAIFIGGQILFLFTNYNWEYRYLLGLRSSFAGSPLTYSLSFREFFSPSLFEEIHQYINQPKKDYRIVSLGIHPGISQYNGFYTLDIYNDIYPLEYKKQFRKIIEKELEKSEQLRSVFDHNSKRCYLMVSELHGNSRLRGKIFSRGITKNETHLKVRDLDLNTTKLKKMGGDYIFSAVEIVNHCENGLIFERAFEDEQSPWKIYLYKVQ